jgi:hypothetical protein
MKSTIIEAIQSRSLLEITCKGYNRVVEPYLLYESKAGGEILHSWQVDGEWDKTPPPDWCNLRLDEITSAVVLEQQYEFPRPEYNPSSTRFHRVIASTPVGP